MAIRCPRPGLWSWEHYTRGAGRPPYAPQILYSSHRGSRDIEHLGSPHDGTQVELLKAAARLGLRIPEVPYVSQGPGGDHTITTADPQPDDLRGALDRIRRSSYAH